MNSKLFSLFFSILLASTIFVPVSVFANHGSGAAGGGCSGDCTPPTLGEDNAGKVFVKNGFSINDNSFDVTHFSQDIATEYSLVNKPIQITVKVYENEGPQQLSHVGVMLGLIPKVINGIQVETHQVQILWEQTFEEITSVEVIDPNDYVNNVHVESSLADDEFGNKDRTTVLKFEFTPVKVFDSSTILVETWDYKRNSWVNYFHNALIITNENPGPILTLETQKELKIPAWFKTNAGFWAEKQINDETFVQGIQYCIEKNIIQIQNNPKIERGKTLHFVDPNKDPQSYIDRYHNDQMYKEWFDANFPDYTIEEAVGFTTQSTIPDWLRTNAQWWSEDKLPDSEFVKGIEWLISNRIIVI